MNFYILVDKNGNISIYPLPADLKEVAESLGKIVNRTKLR